MRGCSRSFDVGPCLTDEPFPDFSRRVVWYNTRLIKGSRARARVGARAKARARARARARAGATSRIADFSYNS